ncbi:5-carboxymethyl-2-hydroxymuconate isomerase [Salinicoccus roseus]|uniref:5-carboxymethyl-2-hydroxymuconate isomerase n=1 Tax=Salinicoccus roseus TaxID=45670 RepID=UPI002301ED08|nr:5-carboxymethyl-2-hydroxymuconate isomerase [Salinicoccus roseus]
MPHIYIEYTSNLKKEFDMRELMEDIHFAVLDQHSDTIPNGGFRTRSIEIDDFIIADGKEDDAFIHITMKIGRGRTEEKKEAIKQTIFDSLKQGTEEIYNRRYLALSVELHEFQRETLKINNIKDRYS